MRYHPCTIISDTSTYDPGIMHLPSPTPSQRHDLRQQLQGEAAGGDLVRGRELVRQEEEEVSEQEVAREENRLRSEVKSVQRDGNLNLQQLGSILQNSRGQSGAILSVNFKL